MNFLQNDFCYDSYLKIKNKSIQTRELCDKTRNINKEHIQRDLNEPNVMPIVDML
jgi:hypothetical protein